ncbi:cation:proton antiporter [Streptomyces sp. SID13031]|uniref:cation:proton antiporter n=1 Tax=Streptomyces sp. SID13031 TaxID=2706046 RepID=UPI0013C5B16A|nr:cation:proton antiporter [Streptomyces sp. SID13031]NEA30234.1 sodium:proton antiporter [Streptomyces sp. SID13031]
MSAPDSSLLPKPGRGLAVAGGLVGAAVVLLGIAYAAGWLDPDHRAAAAGPAAPAAASPAQLMWRLLIAVAVVCALATVFGRLARRIGQPAVVGEIIAGLVLGPSVIGSLAPGLFDAIVPKEVLPNLNLLAQGGLAIFMFTVGAEFGRDKLGRDRGAIAGASLAIMAVPFALGVIAALPLYSTLAGANVGRLPFVIFIGTALAITAFPVLARIVQDFGLVGTRLGSLAMLCAAVADVLAWCALAIVLAMTKSADITTALVALVLTILVGVLSVFVLKPVLRWLADRYAAVLPTPILVLSVLALILGLAAATDAIGVHAIFGGFLAGLVLPKGILPVNQVSEQIGGLNRALLVPVFFASIGLKTDINAAISHPKVLAAGALLLVAAVVGKFLGATPVARAGGLPARSALGLGVLMNARGITEIVVLSAGLSAGLINQGAFTVMVMMALITTMMALPLLKLLGSSLREPSATERLPVADAYASGDAKTVVP